MSYNGIWKFFSHHITNRQRFLDFQAYFFLLFSLFKSFSCYWLTILCYIVFISYLHDWHYYLFCFASCRSFYFTPYEIENLIKKCITKTLKQVHLQFFRRSILKEIFHEDFFFFFYIYNIHTIYKNKFQFLEMIDLIKKLI